MGLEKYGFPTAGEIENSAYNQATNADMYTALVAKAIYDILQLKRNIHNIDKDQASSKSFAVKVLGNAVNCRNYSISLHGIKIIVIIRYVSVAHCPC